jgi:hypothetical protein
LTHTKGLRERANDAKSDQPRHNFARHVRSSLVHQPRGLARTVSELVGSTNKKSVVGVHCAVLAGEVIIVVRTSRSPEHTVVRLHEVGYTKRVEMGFKQRVGLTDGDDV